VVRDESGRATLVNGTARDVTRRRQTERELTALLHGNRQLARLALSGQEAERRRLAQELHDELGQHLVAIKMTAERLESPATSEAAELRLAARGIRTQVEEAIGAVRRISSSIRPPTLDQLGLGDALRELLAEWQGRYPDLEFRLETSGRLRDIEDPAKTTLYRTVQECLTNFVRHAAGSQVRVGVQERRAGAAGVPASTGGPAGHAGEGTHVELEVIDDGRGAPGIGFSPGTGLLGVRERVLAAGGTVHMGAGPEGGFRVQVHVPTRAGAEL
jgi:signal transduction histidine kinase